MVTRIKSVFAGIVNPDSLAAGDVWEREFVSR
jgi:hypothetical protein